MSVASPNAAAFLELARHSKAINAQRSIWRPILECRIDSGDGRIDTINQGRTMVMRVKVSPGTIAGDVDEGHGKLADVFRRNMTSGQEIGAAVAVYRDGVKVVDLWGGYRADVRRSVRLRPRHAGGRARPAPHGGAVAINCKG
jgi:Beta-lactamase